LDSDRRRGGTIVCIACARIGALCVERRPERDDRVGIWRRCVGRERLGCLLAELLRLGLHSVGLV
jgi:hypothetical protein